MVPARTSARWGLLSVLAALSVALAGCATPEESSDTGDGTGDIADQEGPIGSDVDDNESDGNETGSGGLDDDTQDESGSG